MVRLFPLVKLKSLGTCNQNATFIVSFFCIALK
jgi:hypothetical protein